MVGNGFQVESDKAEGNSFQDEFEDEFEKCI